MAMGNQSLHMIGKALGHKSATATQIYSRLTHDPVRQAMEKAQNDILSAAKLLNSTDDGIAQKTYSATGTKKRKRTASPKEAALTAK